MNMNIQSRVEFVSISQNILLWKVRTIIVRTTWTKVTTGASFSPGKFENIQQNKISVSKKEEIS